MKKVKRIFLIEDDEHEQDMFSYLLRFVDGVILQDIAADGVEALDKLDRAAILPDVIFTDIHMPRMNGIECLSEIRKRPQLHAIPVVVMSTDTSRVDLMRALGARAFIKKIGDIDKLREQLNLFIHLDYVRDIEIALQTFHIKH